MKKEPLIDVQIKVLVDIFELASCKSASSGSDAQRVAEVKPRLCCNTLEKYNPKSTLLHTVLTHTLKYYCTLIDMCGEVHNTAV